MSGAAQDRVCAVCGGSRFVHVFKSKDRMHHIDGDFDVYRCADCKLMFIHPFLSAEVLRGYYPKDYYSYSASETSEPQEDPRKNIFDHFRHPLRAANGLGYSKILGQNRDISVAEGARVLDIGCGDGGYLLKKKRQGCVCYGIDISKEALRKLKETDPSITTFCGNAWDSGFPSDSFDLITLSHVLEHVPEMGCLLSEISRLLKKGGVARIQVPNSASLTSKLFGIFWIHLDTPRHVYVFNASNLGRALKKVGCEIQSMRTIENSYSVLGSALYLYNALLRKKKALMEMKGFWDSEVLKMLLFPYCFLVNIFNIGDTLEVVFRKGSEG